MATYAHLPLELRQLIWEHIILGTDVLHYTALIEKYNSKVEVSFFLSPKHTFTTWHIDNEARDFTTKFIARWTSNEAFLASRTIYIRNFPSLFMSWFERARNTTFVSYTPRGFRHLALPGSDHRHLRRWGRKSDSVFLYRHLVRLYDAADDEQFLRILGGKVPPRQIDFVVEPKMPGWSREAAYPSYPRPLVLAVDGTIVQPLYKAELRSEMLQARVAAHWQRRRVIKVFPLVISKIVQWKSHEESDFEESQSG